MARRAYVPSGKSGSGALPVLLGATFAAAIVGGVIEGFVSQWLSLLLVFPLALGLLVGGVGGSIVTSRRVRNPIVAGLVGATMGLVSAGAVHFMEYERARQNLAEVFAKDPRLTDFVRENGVDKAVDAALAGPSGASPFVGYLGIAADNGITITHAGGGSESSPTLTGVGVYVLWIIELLIASGVAAFMIGGQAGEPFCEPCNAWYNTAQNLALGSGDKASVKATLERIDRRELRRAIEEIGGSDGKTALTLILRGCAQCEDHEPLLEVKRVTGIGRKQEVKKVYATLLSPREADELRPRARPVADAG